MKKEHKFSIGDRVVINHKCVEEYWDIKGTIKKQLDDPDPNNGPLVNYVEFDLLPYFDTTGTLKGEYFADAELDLLPNG